MAECSSCHKPITWARAKESHKPIPLDPQPVENGNIVRVGMEGSTPIVVFLKKGQTTSNPRYRSHFTTCRYRQQHQQPKPKKAKPAPAPSLFDA